MSSQASSEINFPRGILRPELYIGDLSSVEANVVRFSLTDAGSPSGAHFLGGRYGKGEVGEFVLIEGQTNLLLGRVVEIHLPEKERLSVTNSLNKKTTELDVVGTIQLLGSVAMDSLHVITGVESYPRIGDRVYAAPHKFVASLPSLMESDSNPEVDVLLDLGSIDAARERKVSVRPEKIFGRHCAILGATGGGKSWTTAKLIEECLRYKSKTILIDATGEYREISGPDVDHVHLGAPVEKAMGSESKSLPATSFIESDFVALFEPAGKVQGPKFRAAIRSLRLAKLRPSLAPSGHIIKIGQSKLDVLSAETEDGVTALLDDPRQEFDVEQLVSQIEQECVYPEGFLQGGRRGEKDPNIWGGESGEFAYCLSLVSRINSILTSPYFDCVFRSSDESLTKCIDDFVANDKKLLRICLSGVSYEFRAREIVANVIGRHLLGMARSSYFNTSPMVVLVDEAHNFLGREIGTEEVTVKLDAFELIAREGRKYGLNICLATQRPRDITDDVLSQIGTLIVHRLTNDRDRSVVERACGEIDRSASSFLPNLKPGEAAVIGVDFPIPLTIQITPPQNKPISDGPNFQRSWGT